MMVLEDSANGCRAAVDAGAFTVAVPNRHTLVWHQQLPGWLTGRSWTSAELTAP